ncbi:MAG TPA: ribosome recycling factor [Candidatus Paceibacterota bacterium]
MAYDLKPLDQKLAAVKEWFVRELAQIRTGRASAAILDGVRVEAYGSEVPLNQVGSVTAEDSQTLRVTAWDATLVKAVEKAITNADLGISVVPDDKGLRVIFPSLTAERRDILMKQAGKKLEEARVSLRKEREACWDDIQKIEKAGGMPEDDKFRAKDEMQKKVDAVNAAMDELLERKEHEIRG